MSARQHLRLAEEFLAVAEASLEAGRPNAATSAAVHAAVCATDAVCVAFTGERPRGKSHLEAMKLLQRACKGTRHEADAAARVRQLAQILSRKTDAEYSGRALSLSEAAKAVAQARRFIGWASHVVRDA